MKPETEEWLGRAQGDIGASAVLLKSGFQRGALFHAHEAVERTLKAIWVEWRTEQPEKTHNLPYLAKELKLGLSTEQREFLRKLYWELIPSRYPEGSDPTAEMAQWYHEKAKEMCEWLRQLLK